MYGVLVHRIYVVSRCSTVTAEHGAIAEAINITARHRHIHRHPATVTSAQPSHSLHSTRQQMTLGLTAALCICTYEVSAACKQVAVL
ncbi:uncharacterized protein BDV17DRAFT_264656 [Aspergillus undulatus]|uniref:uncharacterized protein n=1 Tax=Aspergillus undulatus TaxID=1810928 RepID=UPI003CCD6802